MQHPKVVVIGAGSLFFGRQAIWQMVNSPHLQNGTLAMVDTDASRLKLLETVARKLVEHKKSPLAIEAHTDHKKALEGADFVVLSFARDSVQWRGLECEVSAKHGIRMCSGDTIGPGGIFRTMRELPAILSICEDIQKQCPDAWVINYINPSTTNGIAIHRYMPKLKSFALCDGLHMPLLKKRYAVRAGIIDSIEQFTPQVDKDFEMVIAGPNHFTWMLRANYKGKCVMKNIADSLHVEAAKEDAVLDKGAKQFLNNRISYELYELYGLVPTCVSHTKEYVRFWQGNAALNADIPQLKLWETEDRMKQHDWMWNGMKAYADGSKPIEEFDKQFGPDHATDIIESMAGGLDKPFYINALNRGAVTNMADDSFMELLCDVTLKDGPTPRPVGDMPRGLRSAMEQILDTHELTAEAAATYSHAVLRKAMITDPLTNSIPQCDNVIKDLLEAEREALSPKWFA